MSTHLSWNEIRVRARAFADEWAHAHYEKGETQSFYNDFFEVFGLKRRQVARFEEQVKTLKDTTGFIDLFWPKILLVEQKSAGRDLEKARAQAGAYFDAIRDGDKPRFQLLCDFQTFELLDRDTGEETRFALADLPAHVDKFGFMIGREKRSFKDQDPVTIKAAELMGRIHDELEASGYTGHDLERYLVRLLFMLFADDTGIFEPRDRLLDYIEHRTAEDGSDLGSRLNDLFWVLNTPEDRRQTTIDEDLAAFPYINGDLFAASLPPAFFTAAMRQTLLEACQFNWAKVSPAIFGSLFQSVMKPEERRRKGAHYTTEKNILKLIGPLFLDDLRAQFARLKALKTGKKQRLQAFQQMLGTLNLFDPACGCGNFLVIAYREIRALELECLVELRQAGVLDLFGDSLSVVDVDQFHGIELEEFPARIAEVAMWMMDHIMNLELSERFGEYLPRIPLKRSPHILHADALETDWAAFLPPEKCSYVLGNPPFIGAKYQSVEQRQQVRDIARLGGSGGTLDYVTAWFLKAGAYANAPGGKADIAFVSTNSITQGEQVAQLWPLLFDRFKLEIAFAHRTFAWGSEARGVAHVHVVIIGLTRRDREREVKRLFSYETVKSEPEETQHKALTAYLFGVEDNRIAKLTVEEISRPMNGARRLKTGVQMIDNGILTLDLEQAKSLIDNEPGAARWLRRYIGGDEFINGFYRHILYLRDITPTELQELPRIRSLVAQVRAYRAASKRPSTVAMASNPTEVGVDERPQAAILVIPNTSSERREYVPMGWLGTDVVANQKLRILPDPRAYEFAILTSAMHMAWMRAITGRMKSDYMYSVGVVYNTFPWPTLSDAAKARLDDLAQAILDARAQFPEATLAELYDPDLMPPSLRKAHQANDRYVDSLYRKGGFATERERVEHLFGLYEALVAPVEARARERTRGARARRAGP